MRPRKVSDERLLAVAGDVIARTGPSFTLADIAAAAGVVPGTLVQRFGSKHGLLVALSRAGAAAFPEVIRSAARRATDPATALRDGVVAAYAPLDDPDTAANNLAMLALDFSDPELRELLGRMYAVIEDELAVLARAAIAAGALGAAPPAARAARILAAVANGTAIRWSIRPSGTLRGRLRTDTGAVIDGWR